MFVRLATGVALLGALAVVPASPALAHHSFAMFDHSRTIVLHGKVTSYQFTNPHCYLEVDVTEGGAPKHYTLEMTSPNMMSRIGWTSRTIKAGDMVGVVVAPLRDGRAGGLALEVTLPSGKKMEPGVPNVQDFKRSQ
ncbi:MAG: hypothetical protein RLZZ08_550 [Pseudomonadota bacterium]